MRGITKGGLGVAHGRTIFFVSSSFQLFLQQIVLSLFFLDVPVDASVTTSV